MSYAYKNPGATPLPITPAALKLALQEGKAARATGAENPYAGVSMTLDYAWRRGYDGPDQARRDLIENQLTVLQEAGQATPLPDDDELSPELVASMATFDVTSAPPALVKYWTKGAGAAIIQWGKPGDFMRCVNAVKAKTAEHGHPMSDRMAKGYCSNLHVVATGGRPGTE